MKFTKKLSALLTALAIILSFAACGETGEYAVGKPPDEDQATLQVFAPGSALGIISTAVEAYNRSVPQIDIQVRYEEDSSAHAERIEAGYECDVYISDKKESMDWLDANADKAANPNKNDFVLEGSRKAVFTGPGPLPASDDEEETEGEEPKTKPAAEDVVYEAAVIKSGRYPVAAQSFIDFLHDAEYEEADETYELYGFKKIK